MVLALSAMACSEVGLVCSSPTMSGISFLYKLRDSVSRFPLCMAFPYPEYYQLIRLPRYHRSFHLSVNCPTCWRTNSSTGTPGASQVLVCISHCMPWPEDPGSLTRSHQYDRFIQASCSLTHSPTTTYSMSRLYQLFRVRDHPYGLQCSLSTLHPFCSPGLS